MDGTGYQPVVGGNLPPTVRVSDNALIGIIAVWNSTG